MVRAIACDRALFWNNVVLFCKALYPESIWYSEMFTIVKQKEQKKKSVSFPIQLFQTHNTFFCALQPPRKPPGSLDKFTTDNYGWQCCFLNLLPFLFCDSLIAPNSLCREERQSYSHYFKNTLIKKTIYSHRLFRCLKEHFRKCFLPRATATSH